MTTAEHLFNSALLTLLVPNAGFRLPGEDVVDYGDGWLEDIKEFPERRKSFYDERLEFLLTIRLKGNPPSSPAPSKPKPSGLLLSFLSHLQVTIDVSYISPDVSDVAFRGRPIPIRTTSINRDSPGLQVPSQLLPPQTPSPMPRSDESDEIYVNSEGTLLRSFIWGDESSNSEDTFRLLWLEKQKDWLAVYKLNTSVSFVRTGLQNPRLCLTASVTLRDKPLAVTPQRRTLMELVSAASKGPQVTSPVDLVNTEEVDLSEIAKEEGAVRLYEVNLLQGLTLGGSKELYLPSTRLGSKLRQDEYSLPSLSPTTPMPRSATSDRSIPILRKAFRKTLQAVSGFQVRMRTVFVPHIILAGDHNDGDTGQEAGSEESTVVLCLELMNSGESEAGYAVESIGVTVSGEDAKIQMISWGEDSSSIFPLKIRPHERYDLLYAVAFMRPAEEDPTSQVNLSDIQANFQRSVSISITGKPFESNSRGGEGLVYPTKSFVSKWTCVLDLSPRHDQEYLLNMPPEPSPSARSALPYPPSPFPPPSPQSKLVENQSASGSNTLVTSDISTKRHTYAGTTRPLLDVEAAGHRASVGASLNVQQTRGSPLPSRRSTSPLPSTLSPPLPALPSGQQSPSRPPSGHSPLALYPPKVGGGGLTPRASSFTPPLGYPVNYDPRRSLLRNSVIPNSPDPRVQTLGFEQATHPNSADLIISVSLLTPGGVPSSSASHSPKHIYPLEEFSLELFAFNRSDTERTYEVSCPERGTYVRKDRRSLPSLSTQGHPGFLPLENQIRIGPLAPSTCQTIRMRFLALCPGIHSVDMLVIRDVYTEASVTLRSAMDFVVLSHKKD